MAEISERLQKYLSRCGVASRRKAEEMIAAGKVKINGRPAGIGDKINPRKDVVTIGTQRIKPQSQRKYIMLHKPRGFVTTMNDEFDRKCITMLTDDVGERVYPVGRLDKNSEGLLLLTNDGEFANMMMHPSCHVPKTYRVTVRPPMSDVQLSSLINGVKLDDGYVTQPADVTISLQEDNRIVLIMTIYEGKNRQIRRMCESVGLQLIRLKRIAIGEVRLGMLPQGKWRDLSDTEIRSLYSASKRQTKNK
ncbi:MAG: rRNA pseudouridine synthase [Clostridia bacterium]|nr:rRNA pseudouridine synthase [Clostridia bacterium]